jgi:hypothetical protein
MAAGALPAMPWWALPGIVAAAGAALVGIRLVPERLPNRSLVAGLAILGTPGLRERLATLTVGVVALTLARVAVLLAACGLPADPAHVVLVYLAVSVLGLLPIGAASNAAATLATAGAASVGSGAAAGIALAATSIAAALVYGGIAATRLRAGGWAPEARARGAGAAPRSRARPPRPARGRSQRRSRAHS